MRKLFYATVLVFFYAIAAWGTPAKLALIYKGPGSCEGCSETTADVLRGLGYRTRLIGPGELTVKNLKMAAIYVQPAGNDNVEETLQALSSEQIKNLREYVVIGGTYVGICAGGYLAGAEIRDGNSAIPGFGLLDVSFDSELAHELPQAIEVQWEAKLFRKVYYQAGPFLMKSLRFPTQIIATYSQSGHAAAAIYRVGAGKVALLGPHFEATEEWYHEDGVPVPDRLSLDLFKSFLKASE